ncbi:MAG: hypothetical protein R3C52_15005 [Hyphomonadaceae bacterium]
MRRILIAAAGLLTLSSPAWAVTVETGVSSDFQKKLEDDYGVRETKYLTEALTSKVTEELAKKGVDPARVVLTIEDARPNRPTFTQVSDTPGLDPMRSLSIGGAKVIGVAYDEHGAKIGELTYDWYETDIRNVVGVSTWHDARWAFDRFARKFAKEVS